MRIHCLSKQQLKTIRIKGVKTEKINRWKKLIEMKKGNDKIRKYKNKIAKYKSMKDSWHQEKLQLWYEEKYHGNSSENKKNEKNKSNEGGNYKFYYFMLSSNIYIEFYFRNGNTSLNKVITNNLCFLGAYIKVGRDRK